MADLLIPAIGESITEVTLTQWLVEDGSYVNEGDLLCEIESDKATLEMLQEYRCTKNTPSIKSPHSPL